jgi:hypothetical protein
MHVVANQELVRRKVRLASAFHLGALGTFGAGLWLSMSNPDQILASYATIVVGLVLYQLGQTSLRRWGPRFRQDGSLARALKGLDDRFTLLAFASDKLPDYLVVGPSGIQVVVARGHQGPITCRGNRWSRPTGGGLKRLFGLFGGVPLGDPSADVARGIERVREQLRKVGIEGQDDLPIGGLVVFTNPAAKLRVEGCSYPIMTLRNLRNYLRGLKGSTNRQATAAAVQALEAR